VFYVLSKTLDVLLSPLTWVLLLALYGLLGDRWQNPRFTCAAAALVLYLFSIQPVANGLFEHLEKETQPSVRSTVVYDAVILLGGVVDHDSTTTWGQTAYNDSIERLLVTFDLLRKGRAKNAILSGGPSGPEDPIVESRVLEKQLEDWGIDPSRLVVERESRNTRENAVDTRQLVLQRGYKSLLLVTSAFHMPRAVDAFKTVGLSVDLLPVDYRSTNANAGANRFLPRAMFLDESTLALREIFGRFVYELAWHGP
jgi:uncharacterized SAM-binding protein YcdF (DUF218 family)